MEIPHYECRTFVAETKVNDMEIITFDHKVYQDLNDKIQRIAEYVFSKEKNVVTCHQLILQKVLKHLIQN